MDSTSIVLQAIVAFVAVMTGLGFIFNLLLRPVRETQTRLEKNQNQLKESQDQFKENLNQLKENQNQLSKRLDHLEADTKQQFKAVNNKLDRLLSRVG